MISTRRASHTARPRISEKIKVEECLVISASSLRTAFSRSPIQGYLGTPISDQSVEFSVESRFGQMQYVHFDVVKTYPPYGGKRYWYVCPKCGRRVARLYATDHGSPFACRRCHHLVYSSQYNQRNPILAQLRKMRSLQRELRRQLRVWRLANELGSLKKSL
jgi:hypothetical protein